MLALAAALCLHAPSEPVAQPAGAVELLWDAPSRCPTEPEVRASLDAMLRCGTSPDTRLLVDARVTGSEGAYVLDLRVTSGAGRDTRTIEATRCEPLGRAAALIAATLADPVSVAGYMEALEASAATPSPTSPSPTPAPASSPSSALARSPSPDPLRPPSSGDALRTASPVRRPSRPRPPRGSLRLEGLVGGASLPRLDAGLAPTVALVLPHARIELGAVHLFGQSQPAPRRNDVALRISSTMAVLRGCGVPTWGRWELPLCAATEIGAMTAQGGGSAVSNATPARTPYATVLAEAHVAFRATPWLAPWIGLQGLVAITRPRFTVEPLDPFFVAPFGGGRVKIGLEVRFP